MSTPAKTLIEMVTKKDLLRLMDPGKVWIAVIEHKHGYDVYASSSKEGLTEKVAKYCRENWQDGYFNEDDPEAEPAMPNSSETLIEEYFRRNEHEYMDFGEYDL